MDNAFGRIETGDIVLVNGAAGVVHGKAYYFHSPARPGDQHILVSVDGNPVEWVPLASVSNHISNEMAGKD